MAPLVIMTDDKVCDKNPAPDPRVCRTGYLGQSVEFSVCLVENPSKCKYAGRVATSIYCHHPDRRAFEGAENP